MRLSRILLVLVFLAAWGGMGFAHMPIKLMVEQWGSPQGIAVSDPSGTLWDGQVEVSFNFGENPLPVVAVIDWHWCPSWGRGMLSACFEFENEAFSGHGLVYRTFFTGRIGMENASFQVNFGKYTDRLFGAPAKIIGNGSVKVDSLLFDADMRLPETVYASGKLSRMQANDVKLGDYAWRLDTDSDAQMIKAKASGGADAFQVKGQAHLTLPSRAYQYEAQLSSASETVRKLVAPFTESKKNGVYIAKGNGKLEF